jgi:hypothetical protein
MGETAFGIYVPIELEHDSDGVSYSEICTHDPPTVSLDYSLSQPIVRLKYTDVEGVVGDEIDNSQTSDEILAYPVLAFGGPDYNRIESIGNHSLTLSTTTTEGSNDLEVTKAFVIKPNCFTK